MTVDFKFESGIYTPVDGINKLYSFQPNAGEVWFIDYVEAYVAIPGSDAAKDVIGFVEKPPSVTIPSDSAYINEISLEFQYYSSGRANNLGYIDDTREFVIYDASRNSNSAEIHWRLHMRRVE